MSANTTRRLKVDTQSWTLEGTTERATLERVKEHKLLMHVCHCDAAHDHAGQAFPFLKLREHKLNLRIWVKLFLKVLETTFSILR